MKLRASPDTVRLRFTVCSSGRTYISPRVPPRSHVERARSSLRDSKHFVRCLDLRSRMSEDLDYLKSAFLEGASESYQLPVNSDGLFLVHHVRVSRRLRKGRVQTGCCHNGTATRRLRDEIASWLLHRRFWRLSGPSECRVPSCRPQVSAHFRRSMRKVSLRCDSDLLPNSAMTERTNARGRAVGMDLFMLL